MHVCADKASMHACMNNALDMNTISTKIISNMAWNLMFLFPINVERMGKITAERLASHGTMGAQVRFPP